MLDRATRDHIRAMRDLHVRATVKYISSAPSTVQNLDGKNVGELPLVQSGNRAKRVNVNYYDPTENF